MHLPMVRPDAQKLKLARRRKLPGSVAGPSVCLHRLGLALVGLALVLDSSDAGAPNARTLFSLFLLRERKRPGACSLELAGPGGKCKRLFGAGAPVPTDLAEERQERPGCFSFISRRGRVNSSGCGNVPRG